MVKYNLLELRHTFLFGDTLFPIHFLVLTAVPLWLLIRTVRRKKVLDGLFAILASVEFAAWFWLPDHVPELLSNIHDVPRRIDIYALAVLGGYLVCTLYAAIRSAAEREWMPLFAFVLGAGSQVMMLVSPTVGPAPCFAAWACCCCFSACLLREAPYLYLLGAGALLAWHWGQAWAAVCGDGCGCALAAAQVLSGTGCLCGGVLYPVAVLRWTMLNDQHDGYQENAAVDAANAQRLRHTAERILWYCTNLLMTCTAG